MRKLLLSALLTTQAFSFVIQTNPPIPLSGFTCNCGLGACDCRQGDISISLNLNTDRRDQWLTYANCSVWMGEVYCTCSDMCVDVISQVSSIRLPYLSLETTQSAVRQASTAVRKTSSWTERIAFTIKDLTGGEDGLIARFIPFAGSQKKEDGTGYTTEDVLSVVKEKSLQLSKTQSENIRNDLTMYILTQLARDVYGRKSGDRIPPSEYAMLINEVLTPLNTEGKLGEFLALYLALKQKRDPMVKDVAYLMHQVKPSKELEELHKAFQFKLALYQKHGIQYAVKGGKNGKEAFIYIPEEDWKTMSNIFSESTLEALLISILKDIAEAVQEKELPYSRVSAVITKTGSVGSVLESLKGKEAEDKHTLVPDFKTKPERGLEIFSVPVVGIPKEGQMQRTTQVVNAVKEAEVAPSFSIPLWAWLIPLLPLGYYLARRKGWISRK